VIIRFVSGGLACLYIVLAYLSGRPIYAVKLATVLIFPVVLIWYSEELGSISSGMVGHSYVTAETPGCFLAFFGWAVLLSPVFLFVGNLFV
jgi:hypothetical protein